MVGKSGRKGKTYQGKGFSSKGDSLCIWEQSRLRKGVHGGVEGQKTRREN